MQDRPACLHCHHVPSDPCSLMSASACTVRLAQPCKNPKAPAKRLKQGQKTSAIEVTSNCFQPSQEDCRFHNPSASAGAGASPVCLGFCSKKLRSTLSRSEVAMASYVQRATRAIAGEIPSIITTQFASRLGRSSSASTLR